MDNKFCTHCGNSLVPGAAFCTSCGSPVNQANNQVVNQPVVNNVATPVDDSVGNKFAIISLLLYFAGSVVGAVIAALLPSSLRNIVSSLAGMCPLAGIVVMIVGRVKYPSNKFLKIVMWIIIGCILLGLVLFILFIIWCWVTCSTMDTSGCN